MAPVAVPIPAGWVKELLPKTPGTLRPVAPVLKSMAPILRQEIPPPKIHRLREDAAGWIWPRPPFAESNPLLEESSSPLFAEEMTSSPAATGRTLRAKDANLNLKLMMKKGW
jgi:hypothetical protein